MTFVLQPGNCSNTNLNPIFMHAYIYNTKKWYLTGEDLREDKFEIVDKYTWAKVGLDTFSP